MSHTSIHVLSVVHTLGTVDLKLVHDGRDMINVTAGDFEYLDQHGPQHDFGRVLKS